MIRRSHHRLVAMVSIVTLIAICGCQVPGGPGTSSLKSLQPRNPISKRPVEAAPQLPHRMLVIWNDTTISDVGKPTVRGFGGRIYFYNAKDDPVQVDGELVVYAYDETQPNRSRVADRKYIFASEDLQKRYSETTLGHSYNIWIPWDEAGGVRKTIALLPVFKDQSGRVVQAGQSQNILPGKTPELPADTEPQQPAARFAGASSGLLTDADGSWSAPAAAGDSGRTQVHGQGTANQGNSASGVNGNLRTTTINVPRHLGEQIRNPAHLVNPSTNPSGRGLAQGPSLTEPNMQAASSERSPLQQKLDDVAPTAADSSSPGREGPQVTTAGTGQLIPAGGDRDAKPGVSSQSTDQPGADSSPQRRPVFGQPGAFR